MVNTMEYFRMKAVLAEKLQREAGTYDVKCAWGDIAIEWHCLANRAAQVTELEREIVHH